MERQPLDGTELRFALRFNMVAKLERNVRRQGESPGISFSEYMCRITFSRKCEHGFLLSTCRSAVQKTNQSVIITL